jgi:hypothetical protein
MAITKFTFNGTEHHLKLITATHRRKLKNVKDLYYGSGGFETGDYIEKWPSESDDFYKRRKDLAHYDNVFSGELDSLIDPIFSKPQVRNTEEAPIIHKAFIEDPTSGRKITMSEYQKNVEFNTDLYGAIFLVCDGPDVIPSSGVSDGSPEFMPYSYYLTPSQITGYTFDDRNALQCIVFPKSVNVRNMDNNGYTGKTAQDDEEYIVWFRNADGTGSYFTLTEDGQVVNDNDVLDFDTYPVKLREGSPREKENEIPQPKYWYIFTIARKMYNLESNIDDNYVKNCFAILTYNGSVKGIKIGANGVLSYVGPDAKTPSFIAPPVAHLDSMNGKVNQHRDNIKDDIGGNVNVAADSSAETRKEKDKRRIEKLKQKTTNLQDDELWLVNIALKNFTSESFDYTVVYIMDFESLTKSDEIDSIVAIGDSGLVNDDVKQELGVDIIAIQYSNSPERRDELIKMQRSKPIIPVSNDTFQSGLNVPND